MCGEPRLRRLLLPPDVGEDHRTVTADTHLRPVVVADPDALDEPEGLRQPCDRRADVRVDEHRDDSGRRNRAVLDHAPGAYAITLLVPGCGFVASGDAGQQERT